MQTITDAPIHQIQGRVVQLFVVMTALYVLLAGRFIYLQGFHESRKPADRDLRVVPIPARRGDIFDRSGKPLAVTVDGYDVSIRPGVVRKLGERDRVVKELSERLQMEPATIAAKVDINKGFAYIKRNVSRATGQAILSWNLAGVEANQVFTRTYPQGELGAQILGRVNPDGKGTAGLEEGLNDILTGTPGLKEYREDGKGQEIPGTERIIRPVHNGLEVRLTLDARVQEEAEEQLEASIQAHHAGAGCTMVVDVPTGQILAMASRPTFNPNEPVKEMEAMMNRTISYAYEPGSTMKMITAAAALNEHTWDTTKTVTCSGSMMIGRRRINCVVEPPYHGGHGTETLRDILRNSCNVGAATVGLRLGGPLLYKYTKKFGLLERSRLGLPGAVTYGLASPDKWARVRLANIAFGQGLMVTPIQLLYAYASIANNGLRMKPMLVGATVNTDTGQVHSIAPTPGIQVVPPHIAHEVTSMLKAVVYDGTGKPSQIPGYTVAGKTGSAQKAGAHGYLSGKFVASFVGFAPASRPRVACLTMIDEPHGLHWGAVCAAPVVREMLRWSMHYLQIEPDAPELRGDGARPQTIRKQEKMMAADIWQGRVGEGSRVERHAGNSRTGARVDSDPAVTAHANARGGGRGIATV